jgi:hypothetical protein
MRCMKCTWLDNRDFWNMCGRCWITVITFLLSTVAAYLSDFAGRLLLLRTELSVFRFQLFREMPW